MRRMQSWARRLTALLLGGGVALGATPGSADALDRGSGEAELRPMQAHRFGVLAGQVSRWPLAPVQRPGERSTAPAVGVPVSVARLDGTPVQTVVSDRQGRFHLRLPAGAYRVSLPHLPAGSWVKDLPAQVTVQAGQTTRVGIRLYTGIR